MKYVDPLRTVVSSNDWCFDNLSGSHYQMTQVVEKSVTTADNIPFRLGLTLFHPDDESTRSLLLQGSHCSLSMLLSVY